MCINFTLSCKLYIASRLYSQREQTERYIIEKYWRRIFWFIKFPDHQTFKMQAWISLVSKNYPLVTSLEAFIRVQYFLMTKSFLVL